VLLLQIREVDNRWNILEREVLAYKCKQIILANQGRRNEFEGGGGGGGGVNALEGGVVNTEKTIK